MAEYSRAELEITQVLLHELYHYDPETGVFTRRVARGGWRAGTIAGAANGKGYIALGLFGRSYVAHRLAWLYIHGEWPSGWLDHINGVRHDNRIVNLRIATASQNGANSRCPKNSKSRRKGVYWHIRNRRWYASIRVNGSRLHLGSFPTPEEAHAAYDAAAREHFGEFARVA